jgi:uncharacterized membrane protein YfcA
MHIAPNILSSFVTLLVTIGPVETAVVFASLTAGVHRSERRSLALRSVMIAGLVLLLFAVAGSLILSLLHISLPAFRVAGGLLLFLQALTLTFSSPGLSSINDSEKRDAEQHCCLPTRLSADRRTGQPVRGGAGYGAHCGMDRRRRRRRHGVGMPSPNLWCDAGGRPFGRNPRQHRR